MSKRLYYSSSSLAAPHIGVVIDDILTAKEAGDEIFWAYCHEGLSSCFMNLDGYPCICQFCHRIYREYQRAYGAGVHMIPIRKEACASGAPQTCRSPIIGKGGTTPWPTS